MVGFLVGIVPLCLLAIVAAPAQASQIFVTVYGRTYKVDARDDKPTDRKLQDVMKALPADIARGPGFKPSHEQVLAEVEELLWIARNQSAQGDKRERMAVFRDRPALSTDARTAPETTGSLSASPSMAHSADSYTALSFLYRHLQKSLNAPLIEPEEGFSPPTLPPSIVSSYRDLNFDPISAYYAFRRIKAAFRSGDIDLISSVVHYPLTLSGKVRRTIRNHDQLVALKERVLNARIRQIVEASKFEEVFVRDKGMMLGEGEIWITYNKKRVGLGVIHLE